MGESVRDNCGRDREQQWRHLGPLWKGHHMRDEKNIGTGACQGKARNEGAGVGRTSGTGQRTGGKMTPRGVG